MLYGSVGAENYLKNMEKICGGQCPILQHEASSVCNTTFNRDCNKNTSFTPAAVCEALKTKVGQECGHS